MVNVELPVGVFDVVAMSSVAVPEPLTDVGLKVVVVPAGAPVTPRATVPLKPFRAPIVTA
jgi:hypothetical protein